MDHPVLLRGRATQRVPAIFLGPMATYFYQDSINSSGYWFPPECFPWNTQASHKYLTPLTDVQFCVTGSIATKFKAKGSIRKIKIISSVLHITHFLWYKYTKLHLLTVLFKAPIWKVAPEPKVLEESSKSGSEPSHESLVLMLILALNEPFISHILTDISYIILYHLPIWYHLSRCNVQG